VVRPLGLGEERRRAHREQLGQARASGGKRRKGGGRKREKKKGKTLEKRKRKEGEGREKKREGGRIRAAIVAPVGHAWRWSRARGQARRAGRGAQRDVIAGFRVKASSFGESGDRAGK